MSAVLQNIPAGPRLMTHGDLSAVMDIERRAYRFPWSDKIFRDCMRVGYACLVLEEEQQLRAYGIMSLVERECHLLNLCVDPCYHHRGIGRSLLRQLVNTADRCDCDTVLLEVRPSNIQAVTLYHSEGFNEIGRRKNYYPDNWRREDALILAKSV